MLTAKAFTAGLADATAVAHAAFVLFVVGGQVMICFGWARGWAWTRRVGFRVLHLVGIGFVVAEAWLGVTCPLTVFESRLRLAAGGYPYAKSFLGYWVDRLLFYSAPEWVFTAVYSAFALLVLITFVAYPPRRHLR